MATRHTHAGRRTTQRCVLGRNVRTVEIAVHWLLQPAHIGRKAAIIQQTFVEHGLCIIVGRIVSCGGHVCCGIWHGAHSMITIRPLVLLFLRIPEVSVVAVHRTTMEYCRDATVVRVDALMSSAIGALLIVHCRRHLPIDGILTLHTALDTRRAAATANIVSGL